MCTDVRIPDRTKKVPSRDIEKVRIASKIVQLFRASRFSTTIDECSNAVPTNHGIKEAF